MIIKTLVANNHFKLMRYRAYRPGSSIFARMDKIPKKGLREHRKIKQYAIDS